MVEDAVAHAPGSSFPSGHATNTAAVALTVTLLVWPLLGPRGRVVVPVVAAACILLTGLDRVMLGVHYPSDVVAGSRSGRPSRARPTWATAAGPRRPPTRRR